MENIKPEIKEEKPVFDEEMRTKILERQKEAEKNPKPGKNLFKLIEDIKKTL